MNDVLRDLGLEYVMDTSNYDALRTQIYEHYGMASIFEACAGFDFPEPLWALDSGQPEDALTPKSLNKEQFFKHMMHSDARALLPFVTTVIASEYENSPILTASASLALDRESLAQIVDRAYHLARAAGAAAGPQARALLNVLMLKELLIWQ